MTRAQRQQAPRVGQPFARRVPGVGFWIAAIGILVLGTQSVHAATFQVSGTLQYQDRLWDKNGYTGTTANRPIRQADVEVVNSGTSAVVGTGFTNVSGQFTISVTSTVNISLYVRVLTRTNLSPNYQITVLNDASMGSIHAGVTGTFPNHNPNTNLNVGTWLFGDADGFGVGQAFNVLDCGVDVYDWLAQPQVLNRYPTVFEFVQIQWSTTVNAPGSFYSGQFVNISSPVSGDTDGWSDSVILHELGHYVADMFHQDDNTGGQHFLGDSFQDPRLSYGEGYATYLCGEVRERRAVANGSDTHVSLYADLAMPPALPTAGSLEFSYDFETGLLGNGTSLGQIGQANETNITSAMWDLHDGPATPDESAAVDDDAIDGDGGDVWDVLLNYMEPLPFADIITFEDFVQGWKTVHGAAYQAAELDFILNTLNLMGFKEDAQEQDDTPASAESATIGSFALIGAGGSVVLNEIELGAEDAVEIYNSSNAAVNLLNWQIEGLSNTTSTIFTFPNYMLQPGAFVYVRERGSSASNTDEDFYGGSGFSLPWANGSPGACILRNNLGATRDFLRWDGVSTASTTPVPPGTTWTGTLMGAPGGATLGRSSSGTDTNAASDWSTAPSSINQPNGLAYLDHTTFDTGDVDHLRLSLIKDHLYSVRTFTLFGASDTYLELLAADGTTVLAAHDNRGPVLRESKLTFVAPATGDFFARISHVGDLTQYGIYRARAFEHPITGVLLAPIGLRADADNTHVDGDPVTLTWLNGSVYDSVQVVVSGPTTTVLSTMLDGDVTSLNTALDRGLYRYSVRGKVGVQLSTASEGCVYAGVYQTSFADSYDGTPPLYSWQAQNPWGTTSSIFFNAPNAITDSPVGDYANNVDVNIELKMPVRLGTAGQLQFHHICITEATYDFGYVEITADDGQTWTPLAAFDMDDHPGWNDGVASNGDFIQETIALSAYDNQVVRIRFRLVTDGGVVEDGWYIDNVSFTSNTTAAPELSAVRYSLQPNHPNPFNPSTTIHYSLALPGRVDLRVYDLRGRLVRTLVASDRPAGWQQALWDGKDDAGTAVASGVYFYRLESGTFLQSRKMLLLK